VYGIKLDTPTNDSGLVGALAQCTAVLMLHAVSQSKNRVTVIGANAAPRANMTVLVIGHFLILMLNFINTDMNDFLTCGEATVVAIWNWQWLRPRTITNYLHQNLMLNQAR